MNPLIVSDKIILLQVTTKPFSLLRPTVAGLITRRVFVARFTQELK